MILPSVVPSFTSLAYSRTNQKFMTTINQQRNKCFNNQLAMIKEIYIVLLEHTRPTLHGLAIIAASHRCHRRIKSAERRVCVVFSVKIMFGLTPRQMSADTGNRRRVLLTVQYARHQPSNREKSALCTKAGINLWFIIGVYERICVFSNRI